MKDILAKIILGLIGGGLLAYTIRLRSQGAMLLDADIQQYNSVAYGYLLIISLYIVALMVQEKLLPDNRRGLLLLGIAFIITSHLYLIDDPSKYIYIADIMKLVGLFFVIAGPTKFLISKKYEEKKFEEEVEIIEV